MWCSRALRVRARAAPLRTGATVRVAAVLLAGASLAGCSGKGAVDTSGTGAGQDFVAGATAAGLLRHPAPAPVLAGPSVAGPPLSTAAYRGRVLVVNFWASWCGPCRAESGVLESAYRQYAKDGVSFLGVSFRDDRADARAFEADHSIGYPSLFDPTGLDLVAYDRFGLVSVPDTVVIDRSGDVVARFLGPVDGRALDRVLTRVLTPVTGTGGA